MRRHLAAEAGVALERLQIVHAVLVAGKLPVGHQRENARLAGALGGLLPGGALVSEDADVREWYLQVFMCLLLVFMAAIAAGMVWEVATRIGVPRWDMFR